MLALDSFSLSFRVPELLVRSYRCLVLTSSTHLEGLAGIAWKSEQDNLRQSEDRQSAGETGPETESTTDQKILEYKLVLDSGYWVLGPVMLGVGCWVLPDTVAVWLASQSYLSGGGRRKTDRIVVGHLCPWGAVSKDPLVPTCSIKQEAGEMSLGGRTDLVDIYMILR